MQEYTFPVMNIFQKLFSGFEKKSSSVQTAIAILGGPIKHTPRDFANFAKEGYQWNVTVYACINEIASALSGIELTVMNGKGAKKKRLEEHPLLSLLERPNPKQSRGEFINSDSSFLSIAGNSYIETVFADAISKAVKPNKKSQPLELWTLRPDRIEIEVNALGEISKYLYRVSTQIVTLDPSRVLHRKLFNPLEDFFGQSPLAAAGMVVDTDNAAVRWNMHLLQNEARPGGIFFTKSNLTDAQLKNLESVLSTKYSGAQNAGRAIVLEGSEGTDWKQIDINPKDMDWLTGRSLSKLEICQAFQVPPEIIGDPKNKTYANYSEARRSFYTETVMPKMDQLCMDLTRFLCPYYGEDLSIGYDKDDIEVVQEMRRELYDMAIRAYQSGMLTVNEARKLVEKEPVDDAFGDTRLVPYSVMPVDDLGAGSNEDDNATTTTLGEKSIKSVGLRTEDAKVEYWKTVDRTRNSWLKKVTGIFERRMQDDMHHIADLIERQTDLTIIDHLVRQECEDFVSGWKNAFREALKPIITQFGESVRDKVEGKSMKRIVSWDDIVNGYLIKAGKKIDGITETTRKYVMAKIIEKNNEGAGIPEIARSFRDDMDYPNYRALRIARTEVIGASNYGSVEGARSTDLPMEKEWISNRDERTREEHALMDGVFVDMNDQFEVTLADGGVDMIEYPGDPTGDPSNIINCRCTIGFKVKDDASKD